ncbi:hypothetical protein [Streptomyces sp. NPDC017940]|uniref:hypothetical protein n=1 Tax=Streptomyces sp. NPDC017940 TaxID=3365017 RepID=UPI0037B1863F
MTKMDRETAEQQADITRLLLHHFQAPLTGTLYVRGVLPVPAPPEAIRIVTGPADAYISGHLTAYEIPLRTNDAVVTAYDITGILRTLNASTHTYSSDHVGRLMGMSLIQVDPISVEAASPTADDNAFTILRTLVHPFTGEHTDPRLRGFLFLDQDRLRLYLDTEDRTGVIAADVRPSGAVTALLSALPSLITEEERMSEDSTDPHCTHVLDLTSW